MNTIKNHLEKITVDGLMEFRAEAFMLMASWVGRQGNFSLGVNGVGQFIVEANGENFTFNNPADAVEKYSELINRVAGK